MKRWSVAVIGIPFDWHPVWEGDDWQEAVERYDEEVSRYSRHAVAIFDGNGEGVALDAETVIERMVEDND